MLKKKSLVIAREKWILLILIFVCLSLTFSVFILVRDSEQERIRINFEDTGKTFSKVFQSRIENYLDNVDALKRLFDSSGVVSQAVFSKFVQPVLTEKPEIQAFEWIPQISTQERKSFENDQHKEGLKNFQIYEKLSKGGFASASVRNFYYPVTYMAPYAGNEIALGFDLGSDKTRRATLLLARDTGSQVATPRITLIQEKEKQFGFLVFSPVYKTNSEILTLDQRRKNFLGYVLGVFRVGASFEAATSGLSLAGIGILMEDRSAPFESRLLYANNNSQASVRGFPSTEEDSINYTALQFTSKFNVAGRTWAITLSALPEYLTAHRQWQSWVILLTGCLMTITLVIMVNASQRRTQTIKTLVEQQTTELKQTQQELINKERLAVLGQLTATISHELRNPLGTISSSLYLVRQKINLNDHKLQEIIQRIDRNVNRCAQIITALGDFSKITKLKLQAVPIDSWLTGILEKKSSPKDLMVECKLDCLNVNVNADPERLQRAFINVLDNAYDAMQNIDKKQAINTDSELKIATQIKNNDRLEISVTDNGTGIAPETLAKIFEPFFSTKNFGTGLGLTISYQIMKQHGGGIEVNSPEGYTQVILWLPIR